MDIIIEPVVETVIETVIEPVIVESLIDESKVVHNSDKLYKSDIKWYSDISYEKPNAYEIDMLSNTHSPSELLAKESEESEDSKEVIVLKSDEEIKKQKTKDLLIMFKVISLYRLDIYVLTDTTTLQPHKLKEFLEVMNIMVQEYYKFGESVICDEFNKVCTEKLFHTPDVSYLPVYA